MRDELSGEVIKAAIAVHQELGPGLLESIYEECLTHELRMRSIPFRRGVVVPIVYAGMELASFYRLDLIVDARLVIELKSVESLKPVHTAQLLTYLRLTRISKGLLINFNVPRVVEGLVRVVL